MSVNTQPVPVLDDSSGSPKDSLILPDNKSEEVPSPAPPMIQSHQNQPNGGLMAWLQVAAAW
jgi:hypothetical protein